MIGRNHTFTTPKIQPVGELTEFQKSLVFSGQLNFKCDVLIGKQWLEHSTTVAAVAGTDVG